MHNAENHDLFIDDRVVDHVGISDEGNTPHTPAFSNFLRAFGKLSDSLTDSLYACLDTLRCNWIVRCNCRQYDF